MRLSASACYINVITNYLYITVSRHNTLGKFSLICQEIAEFRNLEECGVGTECQGIWESGAPSHFFTGERITASRPVSVRVKKFEIVRRISGKPAFKHSTAPASSVFSTPGNRYENTKKTGFAHLRNKGRFGRRYRPRHAVQRVGIRARGDHRPVGTAADAHGSRSHGASRLCVGWWPLALGWPRL
jgi:hypothetical protein